MYRSYENPFCLRKLLNMRRIEREREREKELVPKHLSQYVIYSLNKYFIDIVCEKGFPLLFQE